jgi:hypothetical protein
MIPSGIRLGGAVTAIPRNGSGIRPSSARGASLTYFSRRELDHIRLIELTHRIDYDSLIVFQKGRNTAVTDLAVPHSNGVGKGEPH